MRVLVIGTTGALGRPLVPLLAASGHEVVAASRSGTATTTDPAVIPETLDLLDPDAVRGVVRRHAPDVVVHLGTAIPDPIDPKRIGKQFALTNRLRTEGTRNLVAALDEVGAGRIVTQGLAYAYEPGDGIRTEHDPLWQDPPKVYAPVADALREQETITRDVGGTVLRLGHIYGPGTIYAPDGSLTGMVRRGKLPIVGQGAARYSFVHVDDVASAVLAAIDHPSGGVFNIVDDEPVLLRDWLPAFAELLGAAPPRRFPAAIARLAVGPFGVAFMNELAGASNARARLALSWRPRFPRVQDGWRADFDTAAAAVVGG